MLTIPKNTSKSKLIKEYLTELNCCNRCILKYLGYKQFENGCDPFLSPETEDIFSDNISNEQEPKRMKPNHCRSCLDVLNDLTMQSCVDQLTQEFEEYNIKEFTTSVTFPMCLAIRERSMFICLKDKFPDIYNNVEFSSIESTKSIFKIAMSNILAEKLQKTSKKDANFHVVINIQYEDEGKETANIRKLDVKKLSRNTLAEALANCKDDIFKKHFPVPPCVQNKSTSVTVTYSSSTLFLGGRYLKFSREMGQTPFVVNDKAITETSVQDIMFDSIIKLLRCEQSKLTFSSSGREDSDTRMLGQGRPFYVQIEKPKFDTITEAQCREIELSILNSNSIVVLNLQQVSQTETKKIKFGEQEKRKHYRALCKTSAPSVEDAVKIINTLKVPLEILQTTPIRVLHRRTQMIRSRYIHELKATLVEGHPDLFYLDLVTQAGTYVKEFVHGDFNRTNTNISNIIGHPTDVVALDVTHVELEWPPVNK